MAEITQFTPFRIKKLHIALKNGTAWGDATDDSCINDLDVQPGDPREIIKRCEGIEVLNKVQIDYLILTIHAHFNPQTLRKMDGLTNTGLIAGVYGYPIIPKGSRARITALVEDENGVGKLVAFPEVQAPNGLSFTIDDTEDEVQLSERELRAYQDENGFTYYEAFVDEVTAPEVVTDWLTKFTPAMVKEITA